MAQRRKRKPARRELRALWHRIHQSNPTDAELYELEARAQRDEAFAALLGLSYGKRRQPRVRYAKGSKPHPRLQKVAGPRRTKRAAGREARQMRDRHGETAPLTVWCESVPKRKTPDCWTGKGRKKKRNPTLLTIGNPAERIDRQALEQARRAYRRFHGVEPNEAVQVPGAGSGVYVMLGELEEVLYAPRRGARSRATWRHVFRQGAALVASSDGKDVRVVRLGQSRLKVDWTRGLVG